MHVLEKMLDQKVDFKWIPFQVWLDTGNISALQKTEQYLKENK